MTQPSLIMKSAAVIGEELALAFEDGQELYLPLAMLRRACPCALCQGEPDALGRISKPDVQHRPESFQLTRFQVVGGYALQLTWADRHSSGIYSFAYLQKLAEL